MSFSQRTSCMFCSVALLYVILSLCGGHNHDSSQPDGFHLIDEIQQEALESLNGTTSRKKSRFRNLRSLSDEITAQYVPHLDTDANVKLIKKEGVSGCLLLRDENHQLAEWLAYHYLTLPLRHLVVAIDPTSLTSPVEILKRWTEDLGGGFQPLDIVLWDESDFYDGNQTQGFRLYLDRQKRFIRSCAQYHKAMNRTWVVMTDPDEFITLNNVEDDDPIFSRLRRACPKHVKKRFCQKFFDNGFNYTEQELQIERPDLWVRREQKLNSRKFQLSSGFGGLTVMDVINEAPWVDETCIVIFRQLFTATESPQDIISQSNAIMHGFEPMKFRTLRYFRRDGKFPMWWGKVIVDVSRTPESDLTRPQTIHSPFAQCGWPMPKYEESALRIHHYLGSWEEFSYGQDCRRSREKFDWRSSRGRGYNYDLQNWLGDFIDHVGLFKGQYLLQGAGDIPLVHVSSDDCIAEQ